MFTYLKGTNAHKTQVLTHLRLQGMKLGYLLNFRRRVNEKRYFQDNH